MGSKTNEKELLKTIKQMINDSEEEELDVITIAEKLNISRSDCVDVLEKLGFDVLNDSVNDELGESVEVLTEDEKKKKVLDFIKKERTMDSLTKELGIEELEIAGIISELRNDGYNILHVVKKGTNVVQNLGNDSLKRNGIQRIDDITGDFSFLAISDTRLCSYYQQLGILNEIYARAFEYGASFVLHCGDISEGLYRNDLLKDTIFAHDTESQCDYICNNYPYIEGMPTYFITGEHDDTHISQSKENIGKLISNNRSDLIYLGQKRAVVSVGSTNILMRHPKGKVAYTISYKSQRHIAAMRSEDKVNIVLNGHWCYMDEYLLRRINQFAIPSVVAQTPEMDFNDTPNTVGYYLINVKLDEKGNYLKATHRGVSYYETNKDEDYRRVKKLSLSSNSDDYQKMLKNRMGDK